jgi:hypothetical protein
MALWINVTERFNETSGLQQASARFAVILMLAAVAGAITQVVGMVIEIGRAAGLWVMTVGLPWVVQESLSPSEGDHIEAIGVETKQERDGGDQPRPAFKAQPTRSNGNRNQNHDYRRVPGLMNPRHHKEECIGEHQPPKSTPPKLRQSGGMFGRQINAK